MGVLSQHIENKRKTPKLPDMQKPDIKQLTAQQAPQEKPDVSAKDNTKTEEPPETKRGILKFFRRG